MDGLRSLIRCVGLTLVLGLVLAPAAAADNDFRTKEFSNKYAYGSVRLNQIDGRMSTTAHLTNQSLEDRHFVSVTKIKILRRGCRSGKWVAKDVNPSKDGFHRGRELDYTRELTKTRGFWRGSAVVAFKKKRNGPVLWKKKFTSPTMGECPNLPPGG